MAHRLLRNSSRGQVRAGTAGGGSGGAAAAPPDPPAQQPQAAEAAAAVAPEADRYWRAKTDCALYTSHFGRQCGEVAAGTVIREHVSFVDIFDNVWIGCRTGGGGGGGGEDDDDESADGSPAEVVWISKYELGGSMSARRVATWECVAPSTTGTSPIKARMDPNNASGQAAGPTPSGPVAGRRAPTAPAASSSSASLEGSSSSAAPSATVVPSPPRSRPAQDEYVIDPIDVEDPVLNHPIRLLPSVAAQYDYFWSSVAPHQRANGTFRDWNTQYQALVEELLYNPNNRSTAAIRSDLHTLFSEFADVVSEAFTTIVGEMSAPAATRRIPPAGTSGNALGVYYHKGIMVRLAIDTSAGVLGGDANAMKMAAHAAKAADYVNQVSPKLLIYHPMTNCFTFRGYRALATSIPPITEASLVTGSSDGGRSRLPFLTQPCLLRDLIRGAAAALSLKPHVISATHGAIAVGSETDGSPEITPFPADCGIFAGADGRWYLLGVQRLLPPAAPLSSYHGYKPETSGLFWRLRPELLAEHTEDDDPGVSSDAFLPGACSSDDNQKVVELTQWIRDAGIPTLAAVLGFLEPTQAPTESFTCTSCNQHVEEHLCFVVCSDPSECCKVCPQCHLDTVKIYHWDGDEEAATRRHCAFSKCRSGARSVLGSLLRPSVTQIFHAHGVNMRYLGYVYNRLPRSAKPAIGHYLEVEMIARAAKHLMNAGLSVALDAEQTATFTANFYLALLQPDGSLAETFWSNDLGPAIQNQFDVFEPFDTSRHDRELLYLRVAELTGIELSPESVASFSAGDRPFVQLAPPHPVMKAVRLPYLVDEAGERRDFLQSVKADLVAAWLERRGEVPVQRPRRQSAAAAAAATAAAANASATAAPTSGAPVIDGVPETAKPFYLRMDW